MKYANLHNSLQVFYPTRKGLKRRFSLCLVSQALHVCSLSSSSQPKEAELSQSNLGETERLEQHILLARKVQRN